MATFRELIGKSFLGKLFPEIDWVELGQAGYGDIFRQLSRPGAINSTSLAYFEKHKVKLGFHIQDYSGGGWTLLHNITLAPGTDLNDRYTLSLVTHEVLHLGQPILTRLSIYGELLAWQYQKQGYLEAFGKEIGELGEAFAGTQDKWSELSRLSPDSRGDLAKAQEIMKDISPRYRSDCLPLFPIAREIWFFFQQKDFKRALSVLINLVTCRA